jgi:hypothetical protein
MRQGWEAEAGNWATLVRAPGHDRSHDEINLPALRELLPEPAARSRRTAVRWRRPAC